MSLLQRKGLGLKGWVLAGAAAAVFAVGGVILGCGEDGDSNTPGGGDYDPPIPGMGVGGGGDPALVGDWRVVSYNGDSESYEVKGVGIDIVRVVRFSSSGRATPTEFANLVDDVWVEAPLSDLYGEEQTWRSKGQTIYSYYYYGDGEIDSSEAEYRISGNSLTIVECDGDWGCDEYGYTKVDINTLKLSLGTVYAIDMELRGSNPRTGLSWILPGDEEQELSFKGAFFVDASCHYSRSEEEYVCEGYYYTTGSRLVLLYGNSVEECMEYDDDGYCYWWSGRMVIDKTQTVELTYKIANKNLELRRSPSGPAEIWLPVERSYNDYDYAPAKSRQSKQASIFGNSNSKGKGIFPRPPAARSR